MSSQVRFDTEGLRRAIEHGDARYQAALYAVDAEVQILDADDPGSGPEVLRGRTAIARWVERMRASSARRSVLDLEATPEHLVFVEELRLLDGTRLAQRSSARLQRGQIVAESVTLDRRYSSEAAADEVPVDADPDASRRHGSRESRPQPTTGRPDRDLAGQYLG